jgi:hypothetical protein
LVVQRTPPFLLLHWELFSYAFIFPFTYFLKIVLEPQSRLDILVQNLRQEAKKKGYTREELDNEIIIVRERLMKELHGNDPNNP